MTPRRKDVRLEVKFRNNFLLSAMEERGIGSIQELWRQIGARGSYSQMTKLVSLKIPARNKSNGDWLPAVHRLAEFFQCMPEELFSESQQYSALEKSRKQVELDYAEIQQLTTRNTKPVTPEVALQVNQLRAVITQALMLLTPREERILRMRFGFNIGKEMTREEIGNKLDVSGERIHHLEARALHKLNHPSISKRILAAGAGLKESMQRKGRSTKVILDEEVLKVL